MPDPVWYRSLYWRIALGFVALLATLLVVQGFVFLWMTGRMTDIFPNRSPAQFAASVASDLSVSLVDQPELDVATYVNDRYAGSLRGFVVALRDGRTVVSGRVPPPAALVRAARARLSDNGRPDRRSRGRGGFDGGRREAGGWRGPGGGFGPDGGVEFAEITSADGLVAGLVAVPVAPPPISLALRDIGPFLAAVALGLLTVGTAVSALVIFRPARRRRA